MGQLILGRGVRLGEVSACLSLGRGTQPAEMLATICCVPAVVITPNVVGVKTTDLECGSKANLSPLKRKAILSPHGWQDRLELD